MAIDVRVRLSKEGEDQVVAAFKKVETQAFQTGKVASKSFSGFGDVLGGLSGLLNKIGIGLSVATFSNFIRQSTEAGEQLKRFQQETGGSIENLSALALVTKETKGDLSEISVSLGRFAVSSSQAAAGTADMVETFRKIGVSQKEIAAFKSQDLVERLEVTAKRFNQLKDGPEKTTLALAAFGRGAQALIPLLNELGEQGLRKIKDRAEELGVVMDQETIDRVAALARAMTLLSAALQGAGIRTSGEFAKQFLPALQLIGREIAVHADDWKDLGTTIGATLRVTSLIFLGVVDTFVTGFSIIRDAARTTFFLIKDLSTGNLKQAKIDLLNGEKVFNRQIDNYKRRIGDLAEAIVNPANVTGSPAKPPGVAVDPGRAFADRASAARAAADAELRLEQARLKLREDQESRSYQQSLITVSEYYARRGQIIEEASAAEIANLEKRRKIELSNPDPTKRVANLKAIDSEVQRLAVERSNRLEDNSFQELQAVRQLSQERLAFEAQILEAQGNTHAARMIQIEQEIEKKREELGKGETNPESTEAALTALRQTLNAQEAFRVKSDEINASLADFGRERDQIQNRAAAGLTSQAQAEAQLLALEKARVEKLQELAGELLRAANAEGKPEDIEKAKAVSASVDELNTHIQASDNYLSQLGSTAVDVFGQQFTDAMGNAGRSTEDFGRVVLSVVQNTTSALQRLIAQILYTKLISAIFHAGAPGIPGIAGQADIARAATGGIVSAPGTGTSDSGVIQVSDGEGIITAAGMKKPGAKEFLSLLNNYNKVPGAPRYADGGLVSAGELRPAGSMGGRLDVGVRLGPGLIADEIEQFFDTPRGAKVHVRTAERNKNALRSRGL